MDSASTVKQTPSVLIVDDVRATRKLLRVLLRELAPFEIQEKETAREAQRCINETPFDIIICDYNLTDMKGVEVLRHARETPHTENAVFIMVTSDVDQEELVEAMSAGVDSYVLKPLNLESLADGLAVACEQRNSNIHKSFVYHG